jgi:HEPN domain-containing protein
MKPLDEPLGSLVLQWLRKAEQDLDAAIRLLDEGTRFREIVGFLSQQATEKYLKAYLVRHEIEFPKTHDIRKPLNLVAPLDPVLAESLRDADFLTPLGVEVRYPGEGSEWLPGGETAAVELARRVKDAVLAALGPPFSGA